MRLVRIAASLVALLIAAPAAGQEPAIPLPAAGTHSARLGTLEIAFVRELLRDEPTTATRLGFHQEDDRLADLTAAGFTRRIAATKEQLATLDAFAGAGERLDDEDAADVQIMRASLQNTLLDAEQEQRWKHDPSLYSGAASSAVYALFSRTFAPLDERARSVIARERAIPTLLAAGKANVTTVDATTADLAKLDMGGAIAFFHNVVPAAFTGLTDPQLKSELSASNAATVDALKAYLAAMNAGPLARPSGTFAIGAQSFARRLELQEGRPITLDLYERVGQQALDESKAAFVATAKMIDPSKAPARVYAELSAHHPAADELLDVTRKDITQLKAFVERKHLVTMPPEFDVIVAPTPSFNAQTSFASTDAPGPFERAATQDYYYVTLPEPSWTAAQKEQHLSFYNDFLLPIVTAHEVVPGHYLNFVLHKFGQLSLVRAVVSNPSYSEGWAHYDEQMVVDEGWGNGDPRVRLAQLQAALQRECRYLVGLREHTQGMSVDQGTRFFMDNAFMPEVAARREALRGTQNPLYGYYTLGKLEILKLRGDYQRKLGSAYTLQKFHDAFLAHGNPPIGVVRRLLLGASDDGKLL